MLKVKDLKISSKNFSLVDGIDFEIAQNEVVSIIGESGSGKSLTATAIMGLLPDNLNKSGEILFNGKNLMALSEREISKIRLKDIAMIYQNPFNALVPVMTIEKQLEYIFKIQKSKVNWIRIKELMNEVDLPEDYLKKYPFELSGGELQRIVILMSMLLRPELLICDEPTTALDSETGLRIISLIQRLKTEYEISVLFISHDLTLAKIIADRVLIMKKGKIIEEGRASKVYEYPKEEYTRDLLNAARF